MYTLVGWMRAGWCGGPALFVGPGMSNGPAKGVVKSDFTLTTLLLAASPIRPHSAPPRLPPSQLRDGKIRLPIDKSGPWHRCGWPGLELGCGDSQLRAHKPILPSPQTGYDGGLGGEAGDWVPQTLQTRCSPHMHRKVTPVHSGGQQAVQRLPRSCCGEIRPSSADAGGCWPHGHRSWPKFAVWAGIGQRWPTIGRNWPDFGRLRPNLANLGRLRRSLGQPSPASANNCPASAIFGRTWATSRLPEQLFCNFRATLQQLLDHFGARRNGRG